MVLHPTNGNFLGLVFGWFFLGLFVELFEGVPGIAPAGLPRGKGRGTPEPKWDGLCVVCPIGQADGNMPTPDAPHPLRALRPLLD